MASTMMSSEPAVADEDRVRLFSGQWSLEMAFRNAKSLLGLDEAQVRKEKSVRRLALVGLWAQTRVILTYFIELPPFSGPGPEL